MNQIIIRHMTKNYSDIISLDTKGSDVEISELRSKINGSCVPTSDSYDLLIGAMIYRSKTGTVKKNSLQRGITVLPHPDKTVSTFIEGCLEERTFVSCQYDTGVDNQCTWFANEIHKFQEELVSLWGTPGLNKRYKQILDSASEKRKKFGTLPQGENLNELFIGSMSELSTERPLKSCLFGDIEVLRALVPQDVLKMVVRPNIPLGTTQELYDRIMGLKQPAFMMNRHGQSFCAIRYGNRYMICDSHARSCGIATPEQLWKYVKMNSTGPNYVLWC